MAVTRSDLARLVAPLKRRIMLAAGRAVLRLIDDASKIQRVQMEALEGEIHDQVERFQHYGFSSRPHPGGETVFVAVGGIRGHSIAVADDDGRYRPRDLETGEVCLYTDEDQLDGGHRVTFKRGQVIEILAGQEVRIIVGGGSTQLVLTPESVRLYTPDFEALEAAP